jgi:hypothetical protein
LGLGFSILSGGLTLACMVLPVLIRSMEEGLRAVPSSYRLSAAALGLSHRDSRSPLATGCGTRSLGRFGPWNRTGDCRDGRACLHQWVCGSDA